MSECRHCGISHNNGSNFCSRKCRMERIRSCNKRGAKKRYMNRVLHGPAFDYDGNTPDE